MWLGPQSDGLAFLEIVERSLSCVCTEEVISAYKDIVAVYEPRKTPQNKPNFTELDLELQFPELWEMFLLFKAASLWYFVLVALSKTNRLHLSELIILTTILCVSYVLQRYKHIYGIRRKQVNDNLS